MSEPPYALRFKAPAFGDVHVVVLWYGPPHNCWRVEVWGDDLDGQLQNMTVAEAVGLSAALEAALTTIRQEEPQ